jgi:quercetin dioxygenase-like cupin family protein
MTFQNLAAVEPREIVPGFHGRFIHTDNLTIAHWEIDEGALLPSHAHIHEQTTMVTEGTFELTVNGETQIVEAGMFAVIPGSVTHAGRAITRCRIIDVFHPARDDYR